MLHLAQFVALVACSLFAGAALYVNVVEHPARMRLDTPAAAMAWAASHRRAMLLETVLAIATFAGGVWAYLLGGRVLWLVGAILVGLVAPWVAVVLRPVNRRMLDAERDVASSDTRKLLVKWARLHAVGTELSLAALILFAVALLRNAPP